MSGFDFSVAELRKWEVNLPHFPRVLSLLETSWHDREFLAHMVTLEGESEDETLFRMYRLTCSPIFVLLESDEVYSLSVASRMKEQELGACHLIVENSEWIKSFERAEPYGFGISKQTIQHFIVNCMDSGFHLLVDEEPSVVDLGLVTQSELFQLIDSNELLRNRMDQMVRPTTFYSPYERRDTCESREALIRRLQKRGDTRSREVIKRLQQLGSNRNV